MKKGTSSKPLIFGILGLLFALPNSLLVLISTSVLVAASSPDGSIEKYDEMSVFYMKLIFWSAIVGFVASLLAKRFYYLSGPIMITSGLFIFISMVTANLFLIFPASLFILGGVICFTQKKI